MRNRALFLDRDGVINVDHGYVYRIEDFEFVEGIFELCRLAVKNDYSIFVITNQAGIGRGYYSEQDFWTLTNWMCSRFREEGIDIQKVYFCPHHAEHGIAAYKVECSCRKPNPGMILQAQAEFELDLERSILIGDKESDIQAGNSAGIGTRLFFHNALVSSSTNRTVATASISSLFDAPRYLSP